MRVSKVYEMPVDAYGDVRTLVRGLPYQCPDDWEDVLDSLDEDSNLYLIKEPDNPKDKLAIAAYLDDRRVGYVASSDNGEIWLYQDRFLRACLSRKSTKTNLVLLSSLSLPLTSRFYPIQRTIALSGLMTEFT